MSLQRLRQISSAVQDSWWADLTRPESLSRRAPEALVDPPEPVALASLRLVEDRRALLAQAMRIAAQPRRVEPAATAASAGRQCGV